MEAHYVLGKIAVDEAPLGFILDGKHPAMIAAALKVRINIVEWYRRFLTREIRELGFYTMGEGGRYWQRGDLLALEMVRKGTDVKESGPEREKVMLEYLEIMNKPYEWGSTPEIQAAACMTKKTVNTWQHNSSGKLMLVSSASAGVPPSQPAEPAQTPAQIPSDIVNAENAENAQTAHPAQPAQPSLPAHTAHTAQTALQPEQTSISSNADSEVNSQDIILAEMESESEDEDDGMLDSEVYEDLEAAAPAGVVNEMESELMDSEDLQENEQELDINFNLFFRHNHYDALLTPRQYDILASVYGSSVLSHFIPMY